MPPHAKLRAGTSQAELVFGSSLRAGLRSVLQQLAALHVEVSTARSGRQLYRALLLHGLPCCGTGASPATALTQRSERYEGETEQLQLYACVAQRDPSVVYSFTHGGDRREAIDLLRGTETLQVGEGGSGYWGFDTPCVALKVWTTFH